MNSPSGSPEAKRPGEFAPVLATVDHPDLPACAGCGRCCHLAVQLRPGDEVPEHLVAVHGGLRFMDQRSDGACMALDPGTRLCTIYADRPQTCRDFRRGEVLCRKALG
jgi:Fe-S-cluster containining protein